MRHSPSAVVAYDRKLRKTQAAHQLDLILRHRALGIIGMIAAARWFAAVAVAAQIGRDHGVALCKLGRNLAPHQMIFRVAMQQ
jgi:hypothetical protein